MALSPADFPVTVLMGGPSGEREVSLEGGRTVAAALSQAGFEVRTIDVQPDALGFLDDPATKAGVVFPLLHGEFGEDGQLQALLEQHGVRYVGSDAASSRLAMNKQAARQAFAAQDLPIPPGRMFHGRAKTAATVSRWVAETLSETHLPCVIKPNCQGSSIGVSIVETAAQAVNAVRNCSKDHGDCLVEKFIDGRELTVGIFAGKALPVLEVKTTRGFYDYHAKYADDRTEYLFDVGLPEDKLADLQALAERAFVCLGCRDIGRVDMMLDREGRPYLLEINTIPGFTSHSLLPKAARRAGMDLPEFCRQIVLLAWKRPI